MIEPGYDRGKTDAMWSCHIMQTENISRLALAMELFMHESCLPNAFPWERSKTFQRNQRAVHRQELDSSVPGLNECNSPTQKEA